jgi:hypothetical protein
MTLKLKDVLPHDCWRFLPNHMAPDLKSTVNYNDDLQEEEPKDKPKVWNDFAWKENDKSQFWEDNCERPIELLEHYSTHPEPTLLNLLRRDLKVGDCFKYLEDYDTYADVMPYVVVGPGEKELPEGWFKSGDKNNLYRGHEHVRLVRRLDGTYPKRRAAPKIEPIILPCISPLDEILRKTLGKGKDVVTGAECLRRLEGAMRTESFGGLDDAQYRLGLQVWEAKLRELQAQARAAEAIDRVSLVCDDQDELPNMVYIGVDD